MKLLLLLTTAACLTVVSAHSDYSYAFWRKYGSMKIMKSCLTVEGLKTWKTQLQMALEKCNSPAEGRSLSVDAVDSADWDAVLSDLSPVGGRTKRSPKYSVEKIRKMKEKLSKQVETFRCVMREVNVTDSTNAISKKLLLDQYRALDLTPKLMNDIDFAVNHCYDCMQCLPLEGRNDLPLPMDVLKAKKFLECEWKLRMHACLKSDLVEKVKKGYFDFKGLDGRFNKLADDETRAAAILMAEQVVGPNDYDMFD